MAAAPAPVAEEIPTKRRCTRSELGSSNTKELAELLCFFCDLPLGEEEHHSVQTFAVDDKVTECALALADQKLLAKLATSDMMAIEARYHTKCLASLYNRRRSLERSQYNAVSNRLRPTYSADSTHSLVFA